MVRLRIQEYLRYQLIQLGITYSYTQHWISDANVTVEQSLKVSHQPTVEQFAPCPEDTDPSGHELTLFDGEFPERAREPSALTAGVSCHENSREERGLNCIAFLG